MAVRIKYSKLDNDDKKIIEKYLIQKPAEGFVMNKARSMYGSSYGMPEDKMELQIYEVDKDEIWLPYMFARALFKEKIHLKTYPNINLKYTGELYEHQKPVVEDAKKQILQHNTTTLWLHPGFGKTVLGAFLACHLNIKTMVIHTMGTLNGQWLKSFQENTNATVWVVGEMKNPPPNPDVVICMDTRVYKLKDEFISNYGLLIIDEAHQWCSTQNRVSKLMSFQPQYVIIESATIEKEDKMEMVIHHIAGTHFIRRDYQKEFNMLRITTNICPEVSKTIHGTNMPLLRRDLSNSTKRNNLIYDLVEKHSDKKILIVSWLVEHCDKIVQQLKERKLEVSPFYGSRKKYADCRIIVGTFSKVGTGFDEALACDDWKGERINLVIMTMLVKNVNFYEQVIGRGLRAESPSFISLVDDNPTIKRHWSANKSWLTKHKCIIKTVNWNGEDTPSL